MEGPILKQERGGAVIANEALETFKSMYYLLKGKRDTDIKLFNNNKKFTRSDIINLNQNIQNKLNNHTVVCGITNVTVTLANREIKDFGNWLSFEDAEWHQSCQTLSIVIEWDFNITFPNQFSSIPQTHTMRVRIGSGLRPNEFFHVVMSGGEDFEIEEVMSEMVCKIDFVNNQLCNELKNIVAEWYEALPQNKPSTNVIKFCNRHRGKIELFISFSFLVTAIFFLNIVFRALIPYLNLNTNQNLIKYIFLAISGSFPLLYVALKISAFYSDRVIDKTISRFRKNPIIELTKGDKNKVEEIKTENNKLLKDLGWKILVSIIVNLLGLIFGQYLPDVVNKIANFYLK